MQPFPPISVIVPTRNRSALLARLLDSFGQVRYPDWELLIIDDGSTDDTAEVVERYRCPGPAIRYVSSGLGHGWGARETAGWHWRAGKSRHLPMTTAR